MADAPRQGNPDWTWDEEVLAFDLYLRVEMVNDEHTDVVQLSQYLRSLPLHPVGARASSFRNPNGVARKLADIGTRDPRYPDRKQTSGSRLDREIWARFGEDLSTVPLLAQQIRDATPPSSAAPTEEEEVEGIEGRSRIVFRRHLSVERDRSLVLRKKRAVRKSAGRLACEVCGYDFQEAFGPIGQDVADVHHLHPISLGARATKLSDLAILCANCHRIAHKIEPLPSIAELRALRGIGT